MRDTTKWMAKLIVETVTMTCMHLNALDVAMQLLTITFQHLMHNGTLIALYVMNADARSLVEAFLIWMASPIVKHITI